MKLFLKSLLLIIGISSLGVSPTLAQKIWAHTAKWRAGDWFVTHEWDDFEKSYTLLTFAHPEKQGAPGLLISCTDGNFSLMFLGLKSEAEAQMLYGLLLLSDSGKEVALRAHADSAAVMSVSAKSAEYLISNSKRLGVRFKLENGTDRDYFYDLGDLSVGKPQLFKICPL